MYYLGNKYCALTLGDLDHKGRGACVCPSISPETDLPSSSTRFLTTAVSLLRITSSEESLELVVSRSSSAGIGSPKVIERSAPARGRYLKGNFLPPGINWSKPVSQTGMTVGCDLASMIILPLKKGKRKL